MRWRVLLTLFAAAVGVALAVWLYWTQAPDDASLLADARQALADQRDAEAERLALRVLSRSGASAAARILAAQAANNLGRYEKALDYLEQVPDSGSEESIRARHFAASLLMKLGRASSAEAQYRRILAQQPQNVDAHRQLVYLFTVEGRRWESAQHLFALVRQSQNTVEELILLGDIWPDYEHVDTAHFLKLAPDDPLPLLSRARTAAHRYRFSEAEQLLRDVIRAYPDLVEAHAWLGWVLLQSERDPRAMQAWHTGLPAQADRHPLVWLVRGRWVEDQQPRAAIRCYWEAVRCDPNFEQALFQLSRTLAAQDGGGQQAAPFRNRMERLYELASKLKRIHVSRQNFSRLPQAVQSLRQVAQLCESLGRLWEAWSWYGTILDAEPNLDWARTERNRLQQQLSDDLPRTRWSADPASLVDLSAYSLPTWNSQGVVERSEQPIVSTASTPRFVDLAQAAGLKFVQCNGADPATEGMRLLETTGGGVAVLDYDGDSWPDIYFTQGCPWPADPDQQEFTDRLFRNLGDGSFEDVTSQSRLGDNRFSQGVAVGDYNSDGLPDLYVANIGPNRLYCNNGDGTFTDVAETAGIVNRAWTTSCVIADLNGDALPDLYEVNYVGGNDVFTRQCTVDGRPRTCPPYMFRAENDRLFLNQGNHRFEDVSAAAGIVAERGIGLGIVVADFDGSGRLSLFIANDGTPNFYYVNETRQPGEQPRFTEQGMLAGLAVDQAGRFQACMGVAIDDADGDGLLDLFVTNFFDESNTLYLQKSPAKLFMDDSAARGLRDPSIHTLGFGTQFIDADLDGWPDLIVTNGHIDDYTYKGVPFKMRPQYFRNLGGGRFHEVPAKQLGAFFEKAYLGRGLARLDYNRDGREDAVISHIGEPAALLANQTQPVGHFLCLRLCATHSDRDAIGTTVTATTSRRTMVRQLTAGDGYLASNQRQLTFGLGSERRVKELVVRWPGGAEQVFKDVVCDAELIVVEGRDQLFRQPVADSSSRD